MAGPVVLILIGALFLAGTMGYIQWEHSWRLFAHYWPVLLILWGIIKLVEHFEAQRSGTPTRGIGAGGVMLVVILVVFGLAATQVSRINWDELRGHMDIDDNDFSIFGHTYDFEDQLSQAFPANASLHVTNDRGAVNISVGDGPQIKVVVHKRINAENQQDADKWNEKTKPQITANDSVVTVNANTHGAGDRSVTTDLDITVPRKAPLVLSTHHGDISVLGRDGDVDITSQKGEVSVSDIQGKVSLSLQGSSARVLHAASDVSVQGRVNDFSLDDVKGAVRLDGEFMESVKLSKCAKSVTFKSSRTDMEIVKLDGDLDLDSGDLRASNLIGPVHLVTREKDIQLRGVSGDLRLQNENGPLEIHMTKLGNVQVDNRNAEVEIHVPEKAGFQLDAHARNGEVETDFNGLKVSNGDDVSTASGTVGGGGPRVVINNEHGNIQVRRGSVVAEAPPRPPHAPAPPEPPGVSDN